MLAVTVNVKDRLLEIRDVDRKGKGNVLLKTLRNGICGTDREIANFKFKYTQPEEGEYLILGHEALAKVISVKDEGLFKENDIVMPINRRGCGKCLNCILGRPDFCDTGLFRETGIRGLDGFMREFFYDDAEYLVKVFPGIEDIAILAQPLSDLEKSVEVILKIQERLNWRCWDSTYSCRKALIGGTGPIGILTSLLLKTMGFDVTMMNKREINEVEEEIVKETGINYYDNTKGLGSLEGGFDIYFDTTGYIPLILDAIRLSKRNSIIALFGFPSTDIKGDFNSDLLFNIIDKQIAIVGLENGQKPHFERALVHLATWKSIWPKTMAKLITRKVKIEDFEEVKKAIKEKGKDEIKVIIEWG